jgi:hypothetical protein
LVDNQLAPNKAVIHRSSSAAVPKIKQNRFLARILSQKEDNITFQIVMHALEWFQIPWNDLLCIAQSLSSL